MGASGIFPRLEVFRFKIMRLHARCVLDETLLQTVHPLNLDRVTGIENFKVARIRRTLGNINYYLTTISVSNVYNILSKCIFHLEFAYL